jgi:hypothetical protein
MGKLFWDFLVHEKIQLENFTEKTAWDFLVPQPATSNFSGISWFLTPALLRQGLRISEQRILVDSSPEFPVN